MFRASKPMQFPTPAYVVEVSEYATEGCSSAAAKTGEKGSKLAADATKAGGKTKTPLSRYHIYPRRGFRGFWVLAAGALGYYIGSSYSKSEEKPEQYYRGPPGHWAAQPSTPAYGISNEMKESISEIAKSAAMEAVRPIPAAQQIQPSPTNSLDRHVVDMPSEVISTEPQ